MTEIKLYMIPVYGRMVMFGKMTVNPEEIGKKQVPEAYVPYVCEWLVEHGAL